MDDSERRYAEIMRRIAQHKQVPKPRLSLLETTLDQLNVLDELARLSHRLSAHRIAYRPGIFKGQGWVGVLTWHQARGYHGYRSLTITGVWARWQDGDVHIIIGEKARAYSAAIFNAESYHKLICKGFQTYYDDDGRPPTSDDVIHLQAAYTPANRLAIRQQIAAILHTL